jgi:hypothetical protein
VAVGRWHGVKLLDRMDVVKLLDEACCDCTAAR